MCHTWARRQQMKETMLTENVAKVKKSLMATLGLDAFCTTKDTRTVLGLL